MHLPQSWRPKHQREGPDYSYNNTGGSGSGERRGGQWGNERTYGSGMGGNRPGARDSYAGSGWARDTHPKIVRMMDAYRDRFPFVRFGELLDVARIQMKDLPKLSKYMRGQNSTICHNHLRDPNWMTHL